jgi:hypothetical protein
MSIRAYQPGDETAQVRIYNIAAAALPGFKPANVDEVARRYRTVDPDPASKLYDVEAGDVVGYAVFNPNGRISYPWCLPEAQGRRASLLEAVLDAMRGRGHRDAWAAYRGDWEPLQAFFRAQGFRQARAMINYVAATAGLPREPVPADRLIRPLRRGDLPRLRALGRGLFDADEATLGAFFWENPYFDASSLFALVPAADDEALMGAALLVGNAGYADPTKIDPAMPCFRLGALGTERERHKRVNGLFSCVFDDEATGATLLAEAVRRLEGAGLTHLAAQAPSDQPALLAFYDRHLHRQGSFPILVRELGNPV